MLKLDIEGYEPAALEGASGLLGAQQIGCIVLEINEAVLESRGPAGRHYELTFANSDTSSSPFRALGQVVFAGR